KLQASAWSSFTFDLTRRAATRKAPGVSLVQLHFRPTTTHHQPRKLQADAWSSSTFDLTRRAANPESSRRQPGAASLSTYHVAPPTQKAPGVSLEQLHFRPTTSRRLPRKLQASAWSSFTFHLPRRA